MSSNGSVDIQRIVAEVIGSRPRISGQSVDRSVAAIVTVEHDVRFFPTTLRALMSQKVLPRTIVIADCTGGTAQPMRTGFTVSALPQLGHGAARQLVPEPPERVDVQLVRSAGARSFSDAISKAFRYASLPASVRALWLLHDDSRPVGDDCLEALVEAWHNTPTVSLIGAKQLDWSATKLHNVGSYAGKHRLESLVVDGEPDQEQYDGRADVFAVSLAGALLPLQTKKDTGEINPWFTTFAEGADFSRRICEGGGRVIVVPQAHIAHRRARFEGIRNRAGGPIDEENPADATSAVLDAAQKYYYTDIRTLFWPLLWVFNLFRALWHAIGALLAKSPWRAWYILCLPWRVLGQLPQMIRAQRQQNLRHGASSTALELLSADRKQIEEWHKRSRAFDSQQHTELLSPLAKSHLRMRAVRRFGGAALMAVVAFVAIVAFEWGVFRQVWGGASLYSPSLLASGASFSTLLSAASTPWAFGIGIGVPAPPAPWLMVWLVASVITIGHPVIAISLMFFLAAPAMALAFWALAGVFTRSDWVRVVVGLLWVALALALGAFGNADVPLLMTMVFLPAAFAFTFRAVGMYGTEDLVHSHASVQAAGCAALCFAVTVACEPQLIFPLVVCLVFFIVVVRSHRLMLLLIPVPGLALLLPTLVNSVHYASVGAWRQLFADVIQPLPGSAPASLSFGEVISRAFALPLGGDVRSQLFSQHGLGTVAVLAALCLIVVVALVALLLPFALRASRMMWFVAITGLILAMVAARICVSFEGGDAFAASVLPGVVLTLLALLSCACIVSGGAVKRFVPLRISQSDQEKQNPESNSGKGKVKVVAVKFGRALLVAVLALCTCLAGAFGMMSRANEVKSSNAGLPMVAVDYLQNKESHRILALQAVSDNHIDFSVMRSRRGDLVDVSPGWRASVASGASDLSVDLIAKASSELLSNGNDDAIETLTKLGFGGIYVSGDKSAADKDATLRLISNINSSDGAQSVVNAANGTYYRLTKVDENKQGVSMKGQNKAQHSVWRKTWLWCLGLVMVVYVLVAIPRTRRYGWDQA
ncbi:glycosyltransferase family 2 protein [Bifidobacterium sp. ESL0784]|uniref:glycosyltransferase family 2 protein n=1 Tax=Bifidobacterium sp. ESL0784 TaxID=2983231 RepID=UPI0023F895CA|nr:glycosyltransferase family 2 protein [Bifidobacterium sp. ESL0784]MDF7641440.1 glycosyltransferase family 2 protein [Bifidobacterium sp. ESL0784]